MKVWIFQTGEPLHSDQGDPRPMRAMNLANSLVEAGHHVTIWSSAFYHQEKRHRSKFFENIKINELLEIRLIPSSGYKRNIGFGRLFDHLVLALKLKYAFLKEKSMPDVAFVGYPPIEFAFVAVKWLRARNVPIMLDVKDQWPHIFVEPLPKLFRPLAKLVLYPYFHMGRVVMRDATAFCAMSKGFLNWMSDFSGRKPTSNDCIIPLSPMKKNISDESFLDATSWWIKKGVIMDGRKRIFFLGSLSQAFDFRPLVFAAQRALANGKDWQFVICGDGAKFQEICLLFAGLDNVVFPGWVDRPKAIALAKMSIAGLAPYRNTDNFVSNIPNKIIDYMSLGVPVLSPLKGEVESLIKQYNLGLIYDDSIDSSLYTVIELILLDELSLAAQSKNALETYLGHFSGEKVYGNLIEKLVEISALK